jgi:hypothetical protein
MATFDEWFRTSYERAGTTDAATRNAMEAAWEAGQAELGPIAAALEGKVELPYPAAPPAGRSYVIARLIEVRRERPGRPADVTIDGWRVPWATATGWTVNPRRAEMPCVSVEIVAERVELTDSMGPAGG